MREENAIENKKKKGRIQNGIFQQKKIFSHPAVS